ncbi:protein phosphatase 2C domain-containing protein [Capnocytophaga leadbetteri]
MKKYILFYIYLIFGISAFAQISAEESLGSIRADMLKEICELKGIPEDIKRIIDPINVNNFKKEVQKKNGIDGNTKKIIEKTPVITSKTDNKSIKQSIQDLKDFNNSIKAKINSYDSKKFEERISEAEEKLFKPSESQTNSTKNLETELSKIKGELEKIKKRVTNLEEKITSIIKEKKEAPNTEESKKSKVFLYILLLAVVLGASWFVIKKKVYKKSSLKPTIKEKEIVNTPTIKDVTHTDNTVITNQKKEIVNTPTIKEEENKATPIPTAVSTSTVLNNNSVKTDKNAFAKDADDWIVVGASVTGNGHIGSGKPCQDNHKYEYLGDGWGIAIVSDGAGSAEKSEIGSKVVAYRGVTLFKELIASKEWQTRNELPTDKEWEESAYKVLFELRNNMEEVANKNNIPIKALSATAIVVIHTPKGLLVTHIGDGRAGYKNKEGNWLPLITPHKGEEANQTIFVPHDGWNIPFLNMSGTRVPESVVIREKPYGFVLMSDGCETTTWLCNQKKEGVERYYDPNKPHTPFFESLDKQLQNLRKENTDLTERAKNWWKFIESGNDLFVRETDDKTMILGVLNL